jgi:hypothetical protein
VWHSSLQSEHVKLAEDKQKLLILAAPQQTPDRQKISTISLASTHSEHITAFSGKPDTQQIKTKSNK